MLSAADAALVGRDPALPSLRTLLDPDAFAELLRGLYPDADVTAAAPTYVRYKPGTSCLVGCRAITRTGPARLYARGHRLGSEKLAKATAAGRVGSPPDAPLGAVAVVPETALVVYPFPHDHELPALANLADPAARRVMLADVFPDDDPPDDANGDANDDANGDASGDPGDVEVLRWKPERRCVARLDRGARGSAVLRFLRPADYDANGDSARRFESRDTLRTPRHLGRSGRHGLVALEWMPGSTLHDALRKDSRADTRAETCADTRADTSAVTSACRRVGEALVTLHDQGARRLPAARTAEDYAEELAGAAAAVAAIAPSLGDRAQHLARRLGERMTRSRWRARTSIHGDLAADQIIMGDEHVAIVDFDRAGYGDPRIDLGNLQAGLVSDVICGDPCAGVADEAFAAVLDGYRAASEKDVARKLGRFTAASLLRCASEPFRHRRPDWLAETEQILERAASLQRGPD